jgi:hypothetical protein
MNNDENGKREREAFGKQSKKGDALLTSHAVSKPTVYLGLG